MTGMIGIAVATLRLRWLSFAGTFVALALGSALVAAMGQVLATTVTAPDRAPQRYAAHPVVVAPYDTLTVPTWRGGDSAPLAVSPGLPADVVAALPGARIDRIIPAYLAEGGHGDGVGRPWAVAPALLSGRAPAGDDEIAAAGHPLGARVRVVTGDGVRAYTLTGVVPEGLFFADATAARLRPQVDALLPAGGADEVRAAVGGRARVLTGDDRARLDPGRAADGRARNNANTIVGIALGFAAFVAVFVVASTFAFAVGQRRQEFALLRAAGALPGQIRRLVYCEALLVSLAAAAIGALAGPSLAPPVLDLLRGRGMAPDWVHTVSGARWPAWTAFGTGVAVALLGAVTAAWRAGRVRPGEALRESAVESRTMPPARWVIGGLTLATALVTMAVTAIGDPGSATNRKSYMPVVMLLVAAAGLLAPALVGLVARRAGGAAPPGTGLLLALRNVTASARRTAAVAAPVLVTVGLAASLLIASDLTDAAKHVLRARPVRADFLVLPDGTAGLDRQLVAGLRGVPGADVIVSAATSVYTLEGDTALIQRPAEAVDGVPEDGIKVAADWGLRVGDPARVWLADGSRAELRVIEVLPSGDPADAYVGASKAFGGLPQVAYVRLRPGADRAAVAAALRGAADGHRASVVSRAAWLAAQDAGQGSASRLGLLVVLGIVLAYTTLALVNTLLMAAPDRAGERRSLGLLGASRVQVLAWTAVEVLVTVALGVVLAAAVTVVAVGGLWATLLRIAGPVTVSVPWGTIGALAGGTALVAVATALVGARR
ncbi:FtsX-like permease family protein [Dactylosporangium aurantiacum]|uniref:FtsX-like permease family protein n=1 Tax=Dactylosporangium aurantiacum TaxID=35754 RepID=A0A9Q9ILH3_9ACTN|nr:FtsX-like permease family protein [Dactylosporangium aurantiacum]MDG6100861.1 FtsX-like permease family protein [Dactylosporangium aurantiacum]UWZ55080.1 FtsX-like permease family protein [Dactylosporangium aurantiacum]